MAAQVMRTVSGGGREGGREKSWGVSSIIWEQAPLVGQLGWAERPDPGSKGREPLQTAIEVDGAKYPGAD